MPATLFPMSLLVQPQLTDPQPLVIYHGKGCPDGLGAALAAQLFYGDAVQLLGLDHGQVQTLADLPPIAGRAVYILDFSFPPELLRAIDEQAAQLVLLDHHQSAADKLSGFACRCGVVYFDMKKSGARLAWEFFHRDTPVPDLIRYIEDRDIWTWQYPESAGYLSALDMEPQTLERWRQVMAFTPQEQALFIERGVAMDAKFQQLAASIAKGAQPVVFRGVEGLMVNAPSVFHSLVGDLLSKKSNTFALMWSASGGDVVKVGLRSQRHFNCIPLAEHMGGGGHPQACGFKLPVEQLPQLLAGSLA